MYLRSWHIRLLTQVLDSLELKRTHEPHRNDPKNVKTIREIISGSISRCVSLRVPPKEFVVSSDIRYRIEIIEIQAYLVMSLLFARSSIDVGSLQNSNMKEWILPIQTERIPGDDTFDAVVRLLQWCHRRILTDERFKDLFSEHLWFQNYLENEADDLNLELERYRDGALAPLPIFSEIDILSGSGDAADVFSQLTREQEWMQLALLQVEIFADDERLRPFLLKLVDQVGKRLKKRATTAVGYLPPWGYRCLDHLLEMDLTTAKKKLGYSWEDLQDKIQSSYENCLYFLKSDLLFFNSRDATNPAWIQGHWDMKFSSSICSSFLEAAKLLQPDSHDGHRPEKTLGTLGI